MLAAAQAARTEHGRNLAAAVVLDLVVLRNAERQAALFRDVLVPRAELLAHGAEAGLASGRTELDGVLDARLELLDARRTLAQLRAERAVSPRPSRPRTWTWTRSCTRDGPRWATSADAGDG